VAQASVRRHGRHGAEDISAAKGRWRCAGVVIGQTFRRHVPSDENVASAATVLELLTRLVVCRSAWRCARRTRVASLRWAAHLVLINDIAAGLVRLSVCLLLPSSLVAGVISRRSSE